MKKVIFLIVVVVFLVALIGILNTGGSTLTIGATQHERPAFMEAEIDPATLKSFAPLPDVMASQKNPITPEKVALGRMLYYDTRLSKEDDISCNSCHLLDKYGVDNQPVSDGYKGQKGNRNAPTVYNAAGHFVQFWDGRAADVEAQAKGPILNPIEMGMPDEKYVIAVLKGIPGYVEAFKKTFPGENDAVTYDNMAKAIGAFERKLVTPSRWDKYLKGDPGTLTNVEKIGFNRFMEANCHSCHGGTYLGGASFAKLGVAKNWPDTSDLGRYQVTKREADKMKFKVPSLRNIEKTGPYFHDGSIPTLEKAVRAMAEYQVGKPLKTDDVKFIVAWLRTLTGEIPSGYIKKPELPKGTAKAASGTGE
jgi:cytochrome c peroxidase